tara:strand:- start:72 stop:827 length:756 start_codon:yes stop_codon:yes gene_type:complete
MAASEEFQTGPDGKLQQQRLTLGESARQDFKKKVDGIKIGLDTIVSLSLQYDPKKSLRRQKELQDNMKKSMTDLNRRITENPRLLTTAGRELTKYWMIGNEEAFKSLVPKIHEQLDNMIVKFAADNPEFADPIVAHIERRGEEVDAEDTQRAAEDSVGMSTEDFAEAVRQRNADLAEEQAQIDAVEAQNAQTLYEQLYRMTVTDGNRYREIDTQLANEAALERQRDQMYLGSGMTPMLTSHYNIARHGQLY